jgi:hypothetical protein
MQHRHSYVLGGNTKVVTANSGHDHNAPKQQQQRQQQRTRQTQKNPSSLLCMVLIFLALSTALLNILYVRVHYHHHHDNNTHGSSGTQMQRVDRKGNVVHRHISTVKMEDIDSIGGGLHDEDDDDAVPPYNASIPYEQAKIGREFLLQLLEDAGVTDIENAVLQRLPTKDTLQHLYGSSSSSSYSQPIFVGQETCATFRNLILPQDRFLAVAGLFNTGTNLMSIYLEANCHIMENKNRNRGMKWQVPWGKHMLAKFKWTNIAQREAKSNKTHVMPVVVVRDPYSWMQSMCRLHYAVLWHHDSKRHCPNLVPNQDDFKLYPFSSKNVPVRLNYNLQEQQQQRHHVTLNITKYKSLAHLWTEWYRQYLEADYPRILVRYEDLMYHPKQVTSQLCDCVGGILKRKFVYMVDSAKWGPGHGATEKRTSLVAAMIKYGNAKQRLRGYTMEDLQLAHEGLDEQMMELFQYNRPLDG